MRNECKQVIIRYIFGHPVICNQQEREKKLYQNFPTFLLPVTHFKTHKASRDPLLLMYIVG